MVSGSDVGEGTHSGGETPVGEGRQVERGGVAPVRGMGESPVAREPRGAQRGAGREHDPRKAMGPAESLGAEVRKDAHKDP